MNTMTILNDTDLETICGGFKETGQPPEGTILNDASGKTVPFDARGLVKVAEMGIAPLGYPELEF